MIVEVAGLGREVVQTVVLIVIGGGGILGVVGNAGRGIAHALVVLRACINEVKVGVVVTGQQRGVACDIDVVRGKQGHIRVLLCRHG